MLNLQNCWTLLLVVTASSAAVAVVAILATLSVGAVFAAQTIFDTLSLVIEIGGKLVTALLAAGTSALTITATVVLAGAASVFTLPASALEIRIGVSVVVSAAGFICAAAVVIYLASIKIDTEIFTAVISAGAVSISVAAAWAVGVTSLIEKETQQVGLRMTSILDAVRTNNPRVLKLLVAVHAGLKKRELNLALIHAVKSGYKDCSQILLCAGADPNARDQYDNSPLLLAAETGSYDITGLLLEAGADIDRKSSTRGTALNQSTKWGYEEVTELLLKSGAYPDSQDGNWNTPLINLVRNSHHVQKIMRMLIGAGCDVNIAGSESKTALHHLATRGLPFEMLLAAGVDCKMADSYGHTALHLAAREGHIHALRMLITRCDVDTQNQHGRTPLHMSAIKGHDLCAKELLTKKADPIKEDIEHFSPLSYAVANNHIMVAKMFLTCDSIYGYIYADQNLLQNGEENLLEIALENRNFCMAKILVIAGYDIKAHAHRLLTLSPEPLDNLGRESHKWLREMSVHPYSLMYLCRVLIRTSLGLKRNGVHVQYLPLPQRLKNYISLKELTN